MIRPDQFDAWRIIPRVLLALYGWICWDTHAWFTALPDPSGPQQLYASVIWGAAAVWFGVYTKTGNTTERAKGHPA